MNIIKLLTATSLLACAATHAQAATITGLFNTGTDANNVALVGGNGVADPHYSIFSSTAPGFAGLPAVTYIHPVYPANDANSRWISLSSGGGVGGSVSVYRLSFDLTGLDPLTALVSGRGATDDLGRIFLNGADTGMDINGFGAFSSFTLNSGFVSGINTLDFRVTDVFGAPTALRVVDLTGTADAIVNPGVPEPASWALMIAGFGLTGAAMRRRTTVRFVTA